MKIKISNNFSSDFTFNIHDHHRLSLWRKKFSTSDRCNNQLNFVDFFQYCEMCRIEFCYLFYHNYCANSFVFLFLYVHDSWALDRCTPYLIVLFWICPFHLWVHLHLLFGLNCCRSCRWNILHKSSTNYSNYPPFLMVKIIFSNLPCKLFTIVEL